MSSVERLEPADQQVLQEVMTGIYRDFDRKSREDNQAARKAMLAQGLTVIVPQTADVAAWREKAAGLAKQLSTEGLYSPQFFNDVAQDLEDYRSNQRGLAASTN